MPAAAMLAPLSAVLRIPACERGEGRFGWLHSRHTFSFGSYQRGDRMGFSDLRVINDDRVAPGMGFGTHPHRNMEIFSYVLSGQLRHRDSMGHEQTLEAGQVQLMSAGTGLTHSEFNPDHQAPVHFLQVWIEPSAPGGEPRYQEADVHQASGQGRSPWQLLVAPEGEDGALHIRQSARVWALRLEPGQPTTLRLATQRSVYVHLIEGSLQVNGLPMQPGDGLGLPGERLLQVQADQPSHALVFDLRGHG